MGLSMLPMGQGACHGTRGRVDTDQDPLLSVQAQAARASATTEHAVTTIEAETVAMASNGAGARAAAACVSLATTAAQHAVLRPPSLPWHSG